MVAPEDGWRPEYGAQLPYSYEYVIEDPGTFPRPSLYWAPQPLTAPHLGRLEQPRWSGLRARHRLRRRHCAGTSSHSSRCCSNGPSHDTRATRPTTRPRGTFGPEIYDPPQTRTQLRGRIENELEANLDYGLLIRSYRGLGSTPENSPDSDEQPRGKIIAVTLGHLEKPTRIPTGARIPAPRAHEILGHTLRGVSATERRSRRSRAIPARFGKANWQDRSPATSYIDDWDGWGWRHIRAKHGWSPADEAATRQTPDGTRPRDRANGYLDAIHRSRSTNEPQGAVL